MSEKCWKQPVARGFSSKIAKNSISLASDERKTLKTARRRPTKCRKCEKSFRYGSKSSIFWKICPNTIVNCRFSGKMTFPDFTRHLFVTLMDMPLSRRIFTYASQSIYLRIWTVFHGKNKEKTIFLLKNEFWNGLFLLDCLGLLIIKKAFVFWYSLFVYIQVCL